VATRFERYGERGLAAILPSPIWDLVGMKLVALSPGQATLEMPASPQIMNTQGMVHGGATSTLADTAMGAACWTLVEDNALFTTIELKVSFLKAVRSGTLTATGTIIRQGRSAAFAECSVTDGEGTLIARASCTFLLQAGASPAAG